VSAPRCSSLVERCGSWWLFILAPLIGAAISSAVYEVVRIQEELIPAREAERALPSEQAEGRH
jgi:hypothetical protein